MTDTLVERLRPERCVTVGHRWSQWGPYIPIAPSGATEVAKGPPEPQPIRARRHRGCANCGAEQVENWQGERQIVRDPSDVERYRSKALGDKTLGGGE